VSKSGKRAQQARASGRPSRTRASRNRNRNTTVTLAMNDRAIRYNRNTKTEARREPATDGVKRLPR
jgi:hypothetical protein